MDRYIYPQLCPQATVSWYAVLQDYYQQIFTQNCLEQWDRQLQQVDSQYIITIQGSPVENRPSQNSVGPIPWQNSTICDRLLLMTMRWSSLLACYLSLTQISDRPKTWSKKKLQFIAFRIALVSKLYGLVVIRLFVSPNGVTCF